METKGTLVAYYRLSVEDDNLDKESNSISNQRLLVRQYMNHHAEFQQYTFTELYDDGYSGITLDRPNMQKLLDMIKKQKVTCIIVKDFSRFSRDYIDLGTYIQQIFPFMGIRFISISDKYDSSAEQSSNENMNNEFKSLLADFYCKDVSDKVKNVLEVKREKGIYSTGSVPFGYCKNPEDKYELLIVPEEAEVIREIFRLHSAGASLKEICQKLNDQGVMTPLEFRDKRKKQKRKELRYDKRYWQLRTVYTILTNETYIGTMVSGKTEQESVGSKRKILKPRSEWKRYENHHEPIISREEFQKVQEDFFQRNNAERGEVKHMLKGKVYCGGCQRKMRIWGKEGRKQAYYCEYAKRSKENECYSGSIDREELEKIVFEEILEEVRKRVDKDFIRKEIDKRCRKTAQELERERLELANGIQKYKEEKMERYEQYRLGKISRDEFLSGKMETDVLIEELERKLEKIEVGEAGNDMWKVREKESMLRVIGMEKLNQEMAEAFIGKIILHEETCVEIKWKFSDK